MTNLTDSRAIRILRIFSLALFALAVQTSPAAITLQPETATFMTNSGTIDVFVTLTNPELTTPPLLSSYNVTVDLVTTTTGTITPSDVVLSFNTASSGNPVNKADVFPTDDVTDTSAVTAPKTSGASATYPPVPLFNDAGLMSINFTVTPGKVGTFNIDLDSALTKLFDDSFTEITGVGFSSGVITIVSDYTVSGWVWMDSDSDYGYSLDEDDFLYFYSIAPVLYYNITTGDWSIEEPAGWIYIDWPFIYELDTDTLMFALPPVGGLWVYHFSTGQWEELSPIFP